MARRFRDTGWVKDGALLQTAVVTAEFALVCNSLGTRVRVFLYAFSYVNISLPGRYEISWEDGPWDSGFASSFFFFFFFFSAF